MANPNEMKHCEAELETAVRKIDSDVPPALEKLRLATERAVNSALSLARAGRRSQSGANFRAVTPGEPLPPSDLTGRFKALKPA